VKLVVSTRVEPVSVLGNFDPVEAVPTKRVVSIDGQELPDNLAQIFLLGLDVATEQYCSMIEKAMKEDGLEIEERT